MARDDEGGVRSRGAAMVRRVGIEHRGGGILVEYRPELFEDARFLALVDRVRSTNDSRLHARALSLVLASWNVARDGRPVPITEEAILDVSLALTTAIVRAIIADYHRSDRVIFGDLPRLYRKRGARRK